MTTYQVLTFEQIDIPRWNRLIESMEFYCDYAKVDYLKLCCSECYFIVNESYSSGLFVPIKRVLKIQIAYTPPVVPYSRWFGDKELSFKTIRSMLPMIKEWNFLYFTEREENLGQLKTFQTKDFTKGPNTLAKRSLKKAHSAHLKIHPVVKPPINIRFLKSKLLARKAGLSEDYFYTFEKILNYFSNLDQLVILQVFQAEVLQAELFYANGTTGIYYLKGVATEQGYKQGAMYFGMQSAIDLAQKTGKAFDFGGSSISGIRNFFTSFGIKEQVYFEIKHSNGPFWFKILRNIKRLLKL